MSTQRADAPGRTLLSKVPEVTVYFWLIKVLCTTVGETAADFLNVSLNLGLSGTSVVTGVLLVVALAAQFAAGRYQPARYWTAVTLVSVFGTLVTDNLTDALGVPLETSTLVFAVLLGVTLTGWYLSERTLSIHSIVTRRREVFYWAAILVTFALGTATGDLMAEALGLGYAVTGVIVACLIAVAALGWRWGLNPVLAFWMIYILTRPLGASIGDLLSQSRSEGGLGLGATTTSLIFVIAIVAVVAYLSRSRADVISPDISSDAPERREEVARRGGLVQTVVVVTAVVVVGIGAYVVRSSSLERDASAPVAAAAPSAGAGTATPVSPLGDLSSFRTITQDTLARLERGDQSGATTRVADLETEWDDAQARLKPRDETAWTTVDDKIDTVLRDLRATSPDPASEKAALNDLLASLR